MNAASTASMHADMGSAARTSCDDLVEQRTEIVSRLKSNRDLIDGNTRELDRLLQADRGLLRRYAQFKADFEEEYCGHRPIALSRRLNPELQTFDQWLAKNGKRIPLE